MTDRNSTQPASQADLATGTVFLLLASLLCGLALHRASLPSYYKPLFFQLAAVLLTVSAGFISTYFTALARARPPVARVPRVRAAAKPLPRQLELARQHAWRVIDTVKGVNWKNDWLPLFAAVLLCAAALAASLKGWRAAGPLPPVSMDQWIVGSLLLLAFPLLVLERRFATLTAPASTDGQALTFLVRLLLFTLTGQALAYALRWFDLPFDMIVEHVVQLFGALVAVEILLRGASYIFMPMPPLEQRRSHAVSALVSLLRLQRPSFKAISASVSQQFGIDLGRSWALGFIRRAALPGLAGMALFGWLLTGVTALDLSQRAVYEAFGSPQAVFHSGLHVYLPWPFGRLRPIEYGVVREIPIAFPDEDEYPTKFAKDFFAKSGIEDVPPVSADRLWEASRPTEASYLAASNQNGRENFEVLNIDLRVIYRIGLSDDAAYSAAYSLEDPESLIRAAAGRMLARYFARYTTASVLGQNRATFVRGFQQELQARLNTLSSSIDILGVVIETIHPPAGAAEAYQEVQASSIEAITKVANAKGDAVRDVHQAEADATESRDSATALAAETVAEAKVGTALFAGDVQAYHESGAAFMFEKRLSVLGAAITPDTHLLLVDHRIPASQLQLIQMRMPGAPPPGSSGN